MTKNEIKEYAKYLLSYGYSCKIPDYEYIRVDDSLISTVHFWNDNIFLTYDTRDSAICDYTACTNKAIRYRFKNIPAGLLIAVACRDRLKAATELDTYCTEKILDSLPG